MVPCGWDFYLTHVYTVKFLYNIHYIFSSYLVILGLDLGSISMGANICLGILGKVLRFDGNKMNTARQTIGRLMDGRYHEEGIWQHNLDV